MRSERSSYTPIDFLGWQESGTLMLTPKFQRRGVWNTAARSYLIDTLLLEKPVPPIYLRVVQSPKRDRVIREVIDGQQRLSAILDFVGGKYALSKNVESPVAGLRFEQLSNAEQNRILHYPFICEVFHGMEDSEVLSIFARLNTHSVKLNAQELRNGRWFGHFKQLSFHLAFEHYKFWLEQRIFTDARIARMAEVELTSELLILGIAGLQDKKKSIDFYYGKFDEHFPDKGKHEARFRETVDRIVTACGTFLSESEFRRPPLFYTLFGATYHRLFGIPHFPLKSPAKGKLSASEVEMLSNAARDLSEVVAAARGDEPEGVAAKYQRFVTACLRQTDNIKPRTTRLEVLYSRAFER